MKIRTRLIQKHIKNCFALKKNNPWCLLGDKFRGRGGVYYGDSIGRRRRGYERWCIAICLDPECKAEIAVNEEDVLSWV